EVEYEPLPGVFDALSAIQPDAPVLHEQRLTSQDRLDTPSLRFENAGNVCSVYHVEDGDLATGFAAADEIFEDVYSSAKLQHGHIEPHAALAYWEPGGKLVVYSATQNPSYIRIQLAELFGLPQSQVRVIVPVVGGGYGGKVQARLVPPAALLSRNAPRPVQVVPTREA